ncbi:helicase-related protein [Spiroplasma alleghenense]|uniref:Uncharacterized protein n=1 Tax=Spiroplasma alleghenense TaxID=216931 RepID=A0A345Z4U7_9MOLU|nr:helicase-related protein [Spiroplasma alleghenense]AXK51626.1 hypothetical protein SALLE_v1c09560 [Spiroplasma alleghenense]
MPHSFTHLIVLSNFLCVVDILTQGVDIPNINNVIFARPTNSTTIFLQQPGRGLRRQSDKVLNVFDLVANINSPNYWYLRLNQLTKLTPNMTSYGYDILELDNVCLIYDKLSYQEVVGSLEKKWAKTYQLNLTQYDIKKTKAKDELTKDEVILYYLFNNKNLSHQWCGVIGSYLNKPNTFIDEKTLNQMDLTSLEKDFQGVRFTKFMDKYKDVNQLGFEDMVKVVKAKSTTSSKEFTLLYNYGKKVCPEILYIAPGTTISRKVDQQYPATLVKEEIGYTLKSSSYFKPQGRIRVNNKVTQLWEKHCHGESNLVDKEKNIFLLEEDVYFDRQNILGQFVIGGNASFPIEFRIDEYNMSISKWYVKQLKDIIGGCG